MLRRRPHIAIVLAGGSGVRFGDTTNKVLVTIGDRPVLAHSLDTFDRADAIDAIVLVVRPGDEPAVETIVAASGVTKVVAVVHGGDTRQGSEWSGIRAAHTLELDDPAVLLHDAARPFCTLALLRRLLDAGHDAAGAIPALGVSQPLIGPDGTLRPTADLVRVQTPQVFSLELLLDTYRRAQADEFSGVDTAETVQHYGGGPIRWVAGDPDNIKVTHPDDRTRADDLARRFHHGRWSTDMD